MSDQREKKSTKKLRPNLEMVTLEWIDEQRRKHGTTDYELSLQLGQQRSYMGKVRANGIKITKGLKAAIWHYFHWLECDSDA